MRPHARRPLRATAVGVVAGASVVALLGCGAPPAGTADTVVAAPSLGLPLDAGVTVLEDVQYAVADGVPLRLDACLPPDTPGTEPRPAVLYLHGGSWRRGDKSDASSREVCRWLASSGYPAFSVGYRFAPEWPFPAAPTDVQSAIAWLREPAQATAFALDPDRVAVVGSSAGGNLAAWVGTAGEGPWSGPDRVAAVVELSAPIDLTGVAEDERLTPARLDYLGCSTGAGCAAAVAASPNLAVDPSDPPVLIVHATDEYVPYRQAELFTRALESADVPVDVVTVEGTGHAIRLLDAAVAERILGFLARTVGGGELVVAVADEPPA